MRCESKEINRNYFVAFNYWEADGSRGVARRLAQGYRNEASHR
jgi:hypothetical protein